MTQRPLVIYARFSTDMQSPKSCADQEREVRATLSRLGLDHAQALVIHDEAESGTKTFRDEFARLEEMVRRSGIGILAVDDQSRLTRADNAFAFITDLVYSGGRFISTGEGIDTDQTGWELRVKVMELHNSTTIRELSRRVRRGQLGRVLSGLSAGDLCFGYESYLLHPEQATENRRGPKPERGVRIHEEQASWVRQIFAWFNEGWSIAAIARELNQRKVPPRHRRSKPPRWAHPHVSKILANEKYVGTWRWGQKTTIRNSAGKKKQVPVPAHQSVVVQRPSLAIIDDATWAQAQEKLRHLHELYRARPGDKRLAGRPHHTEVYPDNLLSGLIYCGECGRRLYRQYSDGRLYLGCPQRQRQPRCPMKTTICVARAEEAVLGFLSDILTSWPDWIAIALATMRQQLTVAAGRLPQELIVDQRRLQELEVQIQNLVHFLAEGTVSSQAVATRLEESEREVATLRERIGAAEQMLHAPQALPDDAWIRGQWRDTASLLREDPRRTARLLRKLFGRIHAHHTVPPGKKRGRVQLRFRLSSCELLLSAVGSQLPASALHALAGGGPGSLPTAPEFALDLHIPGQIERWGPVVHELRARDVPWREICAQTGLGKSTAEVAWREYRKLLAVQQAAGSADQGDSQDDNQGYRQAVA